MARTIWRFVIAPGDNEITAPSGVMFLHVENVGSILFMWGLVDTDKPERKHFVSVVPDQHPAPTLRGSEHAIYVGSVVTEVDDGPVGFHVFHCRDFSWRGNAEAAEAGGSDEAFTEDLTAGERP